jgi:hypothetical protein
MGNSISKTSAKSAAAEYSPQHAGLSDEEASKDAFFVQLAEIAEAMIARHGRDFAMGTMVLSARFIAEGKPLIKRTDGGGEADQAVKPGAT